VAAPEDHRVRGHDALDHRIRARRWLRDRKRRDLPSGGWWSGLERHAREV